MFKPSKDAARHGVLYATNAQRQGGQLATPLLRSNMLSYNTITSCIQYTNPPFGAAFRICITLFAILLLFAMINTTCYGIGNIPQ